MSTIHHLTCQSFGEPLSCCLASQLEQVGGACACAFFKKETRAALPPVNL